MGYDLPAKEGRAGTGMIRGRRTFRANEPPAPTRCAARLLVLSYFHHA
jgi:hypothetical protein